METGLTRLRRDQLVDTTNLADKCKLKLPALLGSSRQGEAVAWQKWQMQVSGSMRHNLFGAFRDNIFTASRCLLDRQKILFEELVYYASLNQLCSSDPVPVLWDDLAQRLVGALRTLLCSWNAQRIATRSSSNQVLHRIKEPVSPCVKLSVLTRSVRCHVCSTGLDKSMLIEMATGRCPTAREELDLVIGVNFW